MKVSQTKELIFEESVKLFAQRSYEAVSIQDIAHAIGRRKSVIYNYFDSKLGILHAAYDFFVENFTLDRPNIDDLMPIIKRGSLTDMLEAVYYEFSGENKEMLLYIYRLINERKYVDERAREIAKEIMIDSGIKYVEDFFNRAIEMGRIAPIDTHLLAVYSNYSRIGFYVRWVLDPSIENTKALTKELYNLNKCVVKHITDLGFIND